MTSHLLHRTGEKPLHDAVNVESIFNRIVASAEIIQLNGPAMRHYQHPHDSSLYHSPRWPVQLNCYRIVLRVLRTDQTAVSRNPDTRNSMRVQGIYDILMDDRDSSMDLRQPNRSWSIGPVLVDGFPKETELKRQ